jgi:hypothetical protein
VGAALTGRSQNFNEYSVFFGKERKEGKKIVFDTILTKIKMTAPFLRAILQLWKLQLKSKRLWNGCTGKVYQTTKKYRAKKIRNQIFKPII